MFRTIQLIVFFTTLSSWNGLIAMFNGLWSTDDNEDSRDPPNAVSLYSNIHCFGSIDRLFVLSSTMAALSMVLHENLTYIGSDTEPRAAAMPRCLQNLTCLKYVCSSQWTSTLHTAKNAEYTVFPQTSLIPEQSSLQYGLQPKIQSFLSPKPNQIPTLGIRIAPEREKIGFKWNTVSRLFVPATPPWLLRHTEIDLSLHSADKAVTPPEVLKSDFTNCVIALKISIIYTNGSKMGHRVSAALCHKRGTSAIRLPGATSIFNAELHVVGEMPSFSTGYRLVTRVLHTHIFLVMMKHSVRHVILH